MTEPIPWHWLGLQPYRPVWERQRALRGALLAGDGGPALLLCEHEPVITLGRRADESALGMPARALVERGVAVERIERGGEATYHGPGQLVGYPIVSLPSLDLTVPRYVAHLEGACIEFARRCGVDAHRREGYPGVWAGRRKIGAVGIHIHRGVTIHGFALNLTVDPIAFTWFTPCGITPDQGRVTSIERLAGAAPAPAEAAPEVARILVSRLLGNMDNI